MSDYDNDYAAIPTVTMYECVDCKKEYVPGNMWKCKECHKKTFSISGNYIEDIRSSRYLQDAIES